MDNIIGAINHAMTMGTNRLSWYIVTKDENHIKECKEWNDIARTYMDQLIMETKNDNLSYSS